MARKGWESLSPGYRARMERAGVSRTAYESGASLRAARGHSKTPERPTARISREQYPEYFTKRQRLIQELQAKKQRIFGQSDKWDARKSADRIREKPASNALLQAAIDADEEDIWDSMRGEESDYAYLFYYH